MIIVMIMTKRKDDVMVNEDDPYVWFDENRGCFVVGQHVRDRIDRNRKTNLQLPMTREQMAVLAAKMLHVVATTPTED